MTELFQVEFLFPWFTHLLSGSYVIDFRNLRCHDAVNTPSLYPRQSGKTTLVRQMVAHGLRYLTLDDELTLLSARADHAAGRWHLGGTTFKLMGEIRKRLFNPDFPGFFNEKNETLSPNPSPASGRGE